MFVTAQTQEYTGLLGELAEALAGLGIGVVVDEGSLVIDGNRIVPHLVVRAHPTPADLGQLVTDAGGRHPVLVVADRISQPGREVLRRAGWGWLDRRGHLRVWSPGVRIEAPLADRDRGSVPRVANPWTTVGLEIALDALIHPDQPVTARRTAPRIGRSVGATHELIGRFAAAGLIGPSTHLPQLPDLFWEASAHWPDDGWLALAVPLTEVSERVGAENLIRVDERAATLGGARIPAAGDLPARCYLRTASALRRARSLVDRNRTTRCWVRRAPVAYLPENPEHPADEVHPWAVAHPVLCAVRLAAEPARGREIVEAWGVVPGLTP